MADMTLEPRVINLEEMMANLIRRMDLSQERIEANLEAHRERVEANLEAHRERFEANLEAHRERVAADLQAYRAEWQAELRAETRKINKQWGELANKMGTLVEDLVAPSLPRILQEVVSCPDGEIVSMAVRVRRAHPVYRGTMQEFDVIASCGEYALMNETKSNLAPEHVDRLIAKMSSARDFFPEYRDHKIVGAVATLYIDPSLVHYATRQGILALAVGDELMDVMNEPGFTLREF